MALDRTDDRIQAAGKLVTIQDALISGFQRRARALIDVRERWVIDQLADITADNLEEKLAALKLPSAQTRRLARLLRQFFVESMAQHGHALVEEMAKVANMATRRQRDLGRKLDLAVIRLVPKAELYASTLAKQEDNSLLARAAQIIRSGVENARAHDAIVTDLRDYFSGWRHDRIDTIAETEITKFANRSRLELFQASGQVQQLQFIAILDARTTPICRVRHLKVMQMSDPQLAVNTPPLHFRCRSILSPVFAFEGLKDDWSDEFTPPAKGFGG